MNRRGLLLVNLGTPDKPEIPEVRQYLRQFLSDPRVLDMAPFWRAIVLNFLILPFRPRQAAEAYQKIWTDRGSPLLFHGLDLSSKVQKLIGDSVYVEGDVHVEFAMRYKNPPVTCALEKFKEKGIDQIVVFPLFPQYSSSAWGSAVEEVFRVASKMWNMPAIQVVPPFYDHGAFLDSFASVANPILNSFQPNQVLMSFHGLPERHITKSDESDGGHCLRSDSCCKKIVLSNRNCYRAQCFATAQGIASRVNLPVEGYQVTFQSRLGRDPWIKPYTDEVVIELARKGVKKLAVMCPAFVADCLETIEEIGMRARDDFIKHGGEELILVPSLNSEDSWAESVVRIAFDREYSHELE